MYMKVVQLASVLFIVINSDKNLSEFTRIDILVNSYKIFHKFQSTNVQILCSQDTVMINTRVYKAISLCQINNQTLIRMVLIMLTFPQLSSNLSQVLGQICQNLQETMSIEEALNDSLNNPDGLTQMPSLQTKLHELSSSRRNYVKSFKKMLDTTSISGYIGSSTQSLGAAMQFNLLKKQVDAIFDSLPKRMYPNGHFACMLCDQHEEHKEIAKHIDKIHKKLCSASTTKMKMEHTEKMIRFFKQRIYLKKSTIICTK
eukprot:TRINITY_DN6645_c0_g1_i1.p1 TRINITY_DN6645_c0_g1~~TRINITY_DN6645_c0_g1_i1.p1  ORF type:complete len:258 (+),score=-0.29 TRINITY_DN6645_c0_g1_i1:100-873(+)